MIGSRQNGHGLLPGSNDAGSGGAPEEITNAGCIPANANSRWQAGQRWFRPGAPAPAAGAGHPSDPKEVKYSALVITVAVPLEPTRAVLHKLLADLAAMVLLIASWFVVHQHALSYALLLVAIACLGVGVALDVARVNQAQGHQAIDRLHGVDGMAARDGDAGRLTGRGAALQDARNA